MLSLHFNFHFSLSFLEHVTTTPAPIPQHCVPNPCHNGGGCMDLGDQGYDCKCLTEFTGPHCEGLLKLPFVNL